MSTAPTLWLVDPGLMEAGGHHAALLETLMQSIRASKQASLALTVYAHGELDKRLLSKLVENQISVTCHFDTVFYQYFDSGAKLGPSGLAKYIRELSLEYRAVLVRALDKANHEPSTLFFPCLNWEHAWALSMAMEPLREKLVTSALTMVCCAMYSPKAVETTSCRPVWYRLAFSRLQQCRNVKMYASERELCDAYNEVLPELLEGIHPCYLMDWSKIKPVKHPVITTQSEDKIVLLYLGDAKVDKGFARLPAVLERALVTFGANTRFLVQFTLAWAYPELDEALVYLRQKAKTEPRLLLHQEFWSNAQLANMMAKIDYAVCTYDTNAYQHKSSGLVWMLAYFQCPFVIDSTCWLTREAKRLGLSFRVSEQLEDITKPMTMDGEMLGEMGANQDYKKQIYTPVVDWLRSQ